MKKFSLLTILLLILISGQLRSQTYQDTTIYLITCSPGTETYSIYGHSAVRVVINHPGSDIVYNWGVFDFNTPHFAWKFAKGRLDYLLDASEFNRFVTEYIYEKRSVYSQKINLDPYEKKIFLSLIQENLLPENRAYRYDFFYDDCSTRIRDLLEKAIGKKLSYPPDERKDILSFREMVGECQRPYPWLKMGVDLIMGSGGEKKADFRNRMFLPLYLQKNLSMSTVRRDQRLVPLLASPETILFFEEPQVHQGFYTTPIFVFTLLFILIVILSMLVKKKVVLRIIDILLFSLFSVLAILMIFFNFFTDHVQMKMNMNIIWFNPAIIVCLICLIMRWSGRIWFRLVFWLSVIYLPLVLLFPFGLNSSFLPIVLILALRSSAHGEYSWNPLVISEGQ
jgi:hypothetical protein